VTVAIALGELEHFYMHIGIIVSRLFVLSMGVGLARFDKPFING
jgi:hypothetical protein